MRKHPSLPPAADPAAAGFAAFDRWQKQHDVRSLTEAEERFQRALKNAPDNVRLQLAYYKTLYALSSRDWKQWHGALEADFNHVNPILKNALSPPAYLQSFKLPEDMPLDGREEILRKAVNQQPHSPESWYYLSRVYDGKGQFHLALYAAKAARALNEEQPALNFQVGNIYNHLALDRRCPYPPSRFSRQAVKYISRAVSLDGHNVTYHNALAMIYNRISLFPLALQEARKAYDLNPDRVHKDYLIKTLLYAGHTDEAFTQLQKLAVLKDDRLVPELMALIAASWGQWKEALDYYNQYIGDRSPNVFEFLLRQWLMALNKEPLNPAHDWKVKTIDAWQAMVLNHFISGRGANLIVAATDACQSTKGNFYTAMSSWLNGDKGKTRRYLNKVVALRVADDREFLWAKAILKGSALN